MYSVVKVYMNLLCVMITMCVKVPERSTVMPSPRGSSRCQMLPLRTVAKVCGEIEMNP